MIYGKYDNLVVEIAVCITLVIIIYHYITAIWSNYKINKMQETMREIDNIPFDSGKVTINYTAHNNLQSLQDAFDIIKSLPLETQVTITLNKTKDGNVHED